MVKVDLKTKYFLKNKKLKECFVKKYDESLHDESLYYVFNNYDEFKSYFIENGCIETNNDVLDLCIIFNMKDGRIIALKGLCDYVISFNRKKEKILNLSK